MDNKCVYLYILCIYIYNYITIYTHIILYNIRHYSIYDISYSALRTWPWAGGWRCSLWQSGWAGRRRCLLPFKERCNNKGISKSLQRSSWGVSFLGCWQWKAICFFEGSPSDVFDMGMDQYLLIPFLMGWTSIYQLFWCSPGVQGLTHCHMYKNPWPCWSQQSQFTIPRPSLSTTVPASFSAAPSPSAWCLACSGRCLAAGGAWWERLRSSPWLLRAVVPVAVAWKMRWLESYSHAALMHE